MGKPKKGVISGREATRRAVAAHRKSLMKKAKKGDQAVVAELISGAEKKNSFLGRIFG